MDILKLLLPQPLRRLRVRRYRTVDGQWGAGFVSAPAGWYVVLYRWVLTTRPVDDPDLELVYETRDEDGRFVRPHPGETLGELLDERGWSVADLANEAHLPSTYVTDVILGVEDVDEAAAKKIARATGTNKQFWLNLQSMHDQDVAARDAANS